MAVQRCAWFRRLEKDTNSGLNDIGQRLRATTSSLFNLYRQDSLGARLHLAGRSCSTTATAKATVADFYNDNGFLERPAVFGTGRPHNYDVTYLGYNGDGHIGRWNLTASAYYAVGTDDRGHDLRPTEDIGALFGAVEVSRDFDWVRLRASGLYASGDKDPYDGKAQGFDAVLENPQFAGADTSYWIRQAVPLIGGGGVALSMRNGVLPSLRSSREFGQSNFTNPGLHLARRGRGLRRQAGPAPDQQRQLPRVRQPVVARGAAQPAASQLQRIGVDASIGVQYRPLLHAERRRSTRPSARCSPARAARTVRQRGRFHASTRRCLTCCLTF